MFTKITTKIYKAMKRFLDTDMETLNLMGQKAGLSFAPYSVKICTEKYKKLYN